MKCSRCSKKAVISQPYSGLALCEVHAASDIEAKAKKEIRQKGGLPSGSTLYVEDDGTFRTFALRIFLAGLLVTRTDVLFVKNPDDTTLVLKPDTLDDVALNVLVSVCAGTQDRLASTENMKLAPLSVIPTDEVFWYAKRNGFAGVSPEIPGDVAEFLESFKIGHPAASYALKNIRDAIKKENK